MKLVSGQLAKRLPALLIVAGTVACSRPSEDLAAQTAADEAATTITAADFRVRIGVLAHDSMRGRLTPSPELEKAARYVAREFEEMGLLPAEGDSYLQTYPLAFSVAGPAEGQLLRIEGPAGGAIGPDEFIAVPGGAAQAAGPLILASLDAAEGLEGAVAVVRITQATTRRALSSVRDLLDAGAIGVLFAIDGSDEYFDGLRRYYGRERIAVGVPEDLGAPTMLVRIDALPAGLQAALTESGDTGGYGVTMRSSSRFRQDRAFNTIGWIEGSDPELRDEFVLFTAHMDHVGVGRPVEGDSIYNGADDDASGTAAVLELAQAFASLPTPPRRSVVFMTVSGEERGLLGSGWYADHPIFPLESTVADLNIDMIGRNWRDTVVAIGRNESSLGTTLEQAVADHPELQLEMIDDPWPEENFYFRSDHYNFARNGVPILFFFTGTHEDYHGPNDEPDRILYDKTSRIARLIFHAGLDVANAPERPSWDPAAYRRVVEGGGS